MAETKIDPKYLKGLKYRYSDGRDVEEEGRKVRKYFPRERALTPDDVLDWKDTGAAVVIVTADGQKVTVQKKEEKNEAPRPENPKP